MSLGMRIFFFGLVGMISGMLAWPCAEIILFFQSKFPTLLLFNAALGATIGLFMGGCFGTTEGIIAKSKRMAKAGVAAGVGVGVAGGLVGFIAGQAALLFIGTTFFRSMKGFQQFGFPLSKVIGWAAFGIFIGSVEGVRGGSLSKVRNGIIGGFIGGIVGGAGVEYTRYLSPASFYARLVGLLILGFMVGMFYGLVENKLTRASMCLLSGRQRGREFLLSQKITRVGDSDKTEVGIHGYSGVDPFHAEIKREKDGYTLTIAKTKKGMWVNDSRTEKKRLEDGDVIRIGDAQFRFTEK
jgi:hypothetical protein